MLMLNEMMPLITCVQVQQFDVAGHAESRWYILKSGLNLC